MVVRLIIDDARMLARVGVISVVERLIVTVIEGGMTWNTGHCRERMGDVSCTWVEVMLVVVHLTFPTAYYIRIQTY